MIFGRILKKDLLFFFLISLFVLFYIIYKSEIVWDGTKRNYYISYFTFSIFFILLFLSSFFWSYKYVVYLRIFIYTTILSLYVFEIYFSNYNIEDKNLAIKKKIYSEKENKTYDERDKFTIFSDKKKLDNSVSIVSSPSNFLNEKNIKIFPLSGISKSETIDCNENGYYSTFLSDRFGFNNEDYEWEKSEIDFLLIGDSNAMGSCVNPQDNIIGRLKKKISKNFLNLGYAGIGPLTNYAILREYGSELNIKNILIIYSEGNDNRDLKNEFLNKFLLSYLNDYTYSQKLIYKNSEKDKFVKTFINKNFKSKKQNKAGILEIIKLNKIRSFFHNINFFKEKEIILLLEHEEVFRKIKKFADKKKSNVILVYMPTFDRYLLNDKIFNAKFNLMSNISKKLEINLIDLSSSFAKFKDPTSLYPFNMKGHLSTYGYEVATEIIYNELKYMKLFE